MPQARLRSRLAQMQDGFYIPLTGGRQMHVQPEFSDDGAVTGVICDNLGSQPWIPIAVFDVVIQHLSQQANRSAIKGDAHQRLGSPRLPLDSIEGRVALEYYGKQVGDSVFRRITPISRILAWAGVCVNGQGYMELIP